MKTELINEYLIGAKEPYSRYVKSALRIENSLYNYYLKTEKNSDVCRWDESIKLYELWGKIVSKGRYGNMAACHNYFKIFWNVINRFDPDTADEQFHIFFENNLDDFNHLSEIDLHLFGKIIF